MTLNGNEFDSSFESNAGDYSENSLTGNTMNSESIGISTSPVSESVFKKTEKPTSIANRYKITKQNKINNSAVINVKKRSKVTVNSPFKSPFKSPLSGGRKSTDICQTPSKQHQGNTVHKKIVRNISNASTSVKGNETIKLLQGLIKSMTSDIQELKKKNSILRNYKNLNLEDERVRQKDISLIEKWRSITITASNEFLKVIQEKILEKHGSFKKYKLDKYENFRKKLRWQLINSIDEKFENLKDDASYENLNDYDKQTLQKDYERSKRDSIDDFNRKCDLKFREMFKEDIEQSNGKNSTSNKDHDRTVNSENDILDEYDMKDLFKEMNLDYNLVYGDSVDRLIK